jgi:hypothetical protein
MESRAGLRRFYLFLVDFFAVLFFRAAGLLAVDFFFAVLFFLAAGRLAVDFFAVLFFLVDFLAVDFFAVLFFLVDFLAAGMGSPPPLGAQDAMRFRRRRSLSLMPPQTP